MREGKFMRYVIVSTLSGEALKFHNEITEDVCHRFNVRKTKLPGHITLKAPFDSDNIDELTVLLENFSRDNKKVPIYLDGYGSFRKDVVFIKTIFSKEAKKVYNELEALLKTLKWLEWKKNESGERVFHVTIASKRIGDKFQDIWQHVNKTPCKFHVYFDNISIYKWEGNTWVLYKKFVLKD